MSILIGALDVVLNDHETLSEASGTTEFQHLIHEWDASLRALAHDIRLHKNLDHCERSLSTFLSRSHAAMPKSSGSQLWSCRRIYTDACILSALVQEAQGDPSKGIATLDHALIIAGAAGASRLDTIHDLISALQSALPTAVGLSTDGCTALVTSPSQDIPPLPSSSLRIPRLDAPSFLAFQKNLSKQPFIITGYALDWPALTDHPWRSARYLRSVAGPSRVVPVEVGNSYLLDSWRQVIMSWDDFLTSIEFDDQPSKASDGEIRYLAQHDLFMQFPNLRNDFIVPDYAYVTLTSDGRSHIPPANEDQLTVNAWLGPKGTVSPPHTDPYHNLYVQVVGRKTVWLAPPRQDVDSVMFSPESTTLQNTSRCDVFGELDEKFTAVVQPHAMSATLEPGDLLFFPSGWWHAFRSESTSFSVSFWF